MSSSFDPIEYKINTKINWDAIAHIYNSAWVEKMTGPFKVTKELIENSEIKSNDSVLDLACGTGVVSREILQHLGNYGILIGIDISRVALSIAHKTIQLQNVNFVEMDAENIGFNMNFDKVVCQYGLMFFPDVNKVLRSIRKLLKKDGKISIAVHGTQNGVPYFNCIMKPILYHIPDIRPIGTPTVHRFGEDDVLFEELRLAGFSEIKIKKLTFTYEVENFERYWKDYLYSTANSIRQKIEDQGIHIIKEIKTEAEKNVLPFVQNERIVFPWDVLIATAYN